VNQKRIWIVLLGARNACRTEQVSLEIGFEGGVGVDKSKMRRPREFQIVGPMSVCRKPREARAILARGWERRLREAEREADVLGCIGV